MWSKNWQSIIIESIPKHGMSTRWWKITDYAPLVAKDVYNNLAHVARAYSTAFNKTNISLVFTIYKAALTKCPDILPSNIWNTDETRLSTVYVPSKI